MTKTRTPAWTPVEYELADIRALKALAEGTANEVQQKRALEWITNTAAGRMAGNAFFSDGMGGERETAFMLGRQFVAEQVVKLVSFPPQAMELMKNVNRSTGDRRNRRGRNAG